MQIYTAGHDTWRVDTGFGSLFRVMGIATCTGIATATSSCVAREIYNPTWHTGFVHKPDRSCYKTGQLVSVFLSLRLFTLAAMEFDRRSVVVIMVVCVALWAAMEVAVAAGNGSRFDELFQSNWASDHMVYDGELLKLKLDNLSGAGFSSKSRYLYGKATAEIKLVAGDSAGTVTAFYMSSDGTKHDEFDFEFLGNTTGEPYLVQTNIYVNGTGNREQRNDLWFDPTADFHTYAILWNPRQVVFLIDETPIRVFRNQEAKGIAFPAYQKMGVYSSLWNADDWATQGGRVKTNWSHAPFVVTYRELRIDGCEVLVEASEDDELRRCSGSQWGKEGRYWWKAPEMEELTVHQSHQLMWVRAHHLIYDYCSDATRFPTVPPECAR